MSRVRHRRRGVLVMLGAICSALTAGWLLLGRLPPLAPLPPARPALRDADAIARFDSAFAREPPAANPECHPRLMAGGAATDRVVVLLHGFTNCPKQFDLLAAHLARRGDRVLIPRLPRHGMADRMTTELGLLTAEELARAGNDAVDIAHGLGAHVTVVGLSSSAVLAAWLAQHRGDIDRAVLLAPAFAPHGVPTSVARRLTGGILRLPNFFAWWDPRSKTDLPGPRQSYPRFASRAVAEVYRLGFEVLDEATRGKPTAKIVVVTSEADDVVNQAPVLELVRRWRARGVEVETFDFPESLRVHHDMIDPEQLYERVRVTYPVIEDLVSRDFE